MKLNDYFKQFIGNISLNPQRIDRIDRAFNTWESIFNDDEELKDILVDFYKQGSYATGMVIKPQNGNEFDIDSVLVLDFGDAVTPVDAINMVAERMKSNEAYKDKISKHKRCVRVDYAGDFHLDVVPAKPTCDERIQIPNRQNDEWEISNPRGFAKWCNDKPKGFARLVKMVKFWRDRSVGIDTAPKSILLTTLLGHHFVDATSDAEMLVLSINELINYMDGYSVEGQPVVYNPALPGENLARDWDQISFDRFKTKLERFAGKARDALCEQDKDRSIDKWRDIFGNDFPLQLPAAASTSQKVAAGTLYVNGKGNLNSESGAKINSHRFYGKGDYGEQ